MKKVLHLRNFAEPLTNAMVSFYMKSQKHFTSDQQPHYIYSPRELTRWKYAINEALEASDNFKQIEDVVRLWAHEAARLFQDRLVTEDEKKWCDKLIDEIAIQNFPTINTGALDRPILFSNYLTKDYISVDKTQLHKHIEARLKTF